MRFVVIFTVCFLGIVLLFGCGGKEVKDEEPVQKVTDEGEKRTKEEALKKKYDLKHKGQGETVTIGELNWTGAIAIAHIMKYTLENKLNIPVKLEKLPQDKLWLELHKGTMDVHPDVWMMNQEKSRLPPVGLLKRFFPISGLYNLKRVLISILTCNSSRVLE